MIIYARMNLSSVNVLTLHYKYRIFKICAEIFEQEYTLNIIFEITKSLEMMNENFLYYI